MRLKRFLKASVTTVSGAVMLMMALAVIATSMGTYLSGGMEEWRGLLDRAAPYLMVWRFILYGVTLWVWMNVYQIHKAKHNQAGIERLRRMGWLGLTVAGFVEISRLMA